MSKLKREFYLRDDVTIIARELIGKTLITHIGGITTGGVITETEAYEGVTDKASHAYGGRISERTKIMYEEGGCAYIYLCYGIHSLFNVVTNRRGTPHAVLIRAIFPVIGLSHFYERLGRMEPPEKVGLGPGKLSKGLGIHYSLSGILITGSNIWIEDQGLLIADQHIVSGKRIGVEYAGEHSEWLYRYYLPSNRLP